MWRRIFWSGLAFLFAICLYIPEARSLAINNVPQLISIITQSFSSIVTILLVSFLPTTALHEGSHYAVLKSLGHQPEFQWKWYWLKNPFIYAPGKWIKGSHYTLSLVAPLFIVNSIAATLVIADISRMFNQLGTAILVVNTASASNDMKELFWGHLQPNGLKVFYVNRNGTLDVFKSVPKDE